MIVLCTLNAKWIHPSLALRLLKANLPGSLINNCTILEFALRQPLPEKISAILGEKPKILGLSVSIWNHEATIELLEALEKEWTGSERPVIILGGPELTPLPSQAEIFRHADFIIRGEGEEVFAEMCRTILLNPQAAQKQFGKFISAKDVNCVSIKTGYDFYTDEDLRQKLIYVESSRGCPYTCAFCQSAGSHLNPGRGEIREFPLEPFLKDLGKLLERSKGKTRTIKFLDRSFNAKPERAVQILEFCLAEAHKAGRQFHFEMVPGFFPAGLKDVLEKFPRETIRIETGIQSFNPETNKLINRISNPEKELEVLAFLREKTNVILHADLIAGLPAEDYGSFAEGFDRLWIALSSVDSPVPFEIQPGILKILPGTPLHAAKGKSFEVCYNKNPPYEITETCCLSMEDIKRIKNFARFWEIIVNRRAFCEAIPRLCPPGKPVFARFMELSEKLFMHFGRNYSIPKIELEEMLETLINHRDFSKA